MGIMIKHKRNNPMMFNDVTIPNSINKSLLETIKVAKPMAVVRFVIKVAIPILVVTRCNALALFPCTLYSWWYLLVRNIQFGIPMTMIKVGTKAVKTVIS